MSGIITRFVSFLVFVIGLTEFGSSIRIITEPEPYSGTTDDLNISCIADGPTYWARSVVNIQIMKLSEGKPIAVINMRQKLSMGAGSQDNMKAEGRVDSDARKSYLTVTINNPGREDAGTYRCQVFYTDENFQILEENELGNVTFQEHDIKDISTLMSTVKEQGRQLISLMNVHAIQAQQIDKLNSQIDQLKNDYSSQKLKTDMQSHQIYQLMNNSFVQKQQIDSQSKQIDELNKDNTKKQYHLDALVDVIKKQKERIQADGIQLQKIIKGLACPDKGWALYKQDKTCIKVFGRHVDSEHLNWSKAMEACKTYGGDLIQIRDKDKNSFVTNMFAELRNGVWIGIRNNASIGYDFKYLDGSPIDTYHPWFQGEPKGDGDKKVKCVLMKTGTRSYAGQWKTWNCLAQQPYACSTSSRDVF